MIVMQPHDRARVPTVGDADLSSRIVDETGFLELAHRDRERRTLHTNHLGQELLGHAERTFLDPIVDLEQPSRCPLVQPVSAVAQDQLSHRDHHDLRVSLEESHQRATAHHLLA
jgi:hypothetical protein